MADFEAAFSAVKMARRRGWRDLMTVLFADADMRGGGNPPPPLSPTLEDIVGAAHFDEPG